MGKFLRQGLKLLDDSYFAYAANTRLVKEFGVPDGYLKRIWLYLAGTLTPSAVTVPGTIHEDGPVNLLRLIEATIDGKPWKYGSGGAFFRLSQLYDETDGTNDGLYTGAAVVQAFEALVPLSAEAMGSVSPKDTLIDGRLHNKLQLAITFGDTSSLVVGNTSTLTISACTVAVYVEMTDPFEKDGDFWQFRESEAPLLGVLTANGTTFPIPIEKGSIVRSILLRTIDGSDLSDAVLNSLSVLINGREEVPLADIEDDFFQGFAKHNFGMGSVNPDGYYLIEFAERNNDGSLVATTGLGANGSGERINSLELRMNTTVGAGATSMVAHVSEMVPPQLKAA